MTAPRKIETEQGIQGEFNVTAYDAMQRHLRDRGWIETEAIMRSGIHSGAALEIGPGDAMPFAAGAFDAVFSNGSLHEWSKPEQTFSEIWRALASGGRFFVSNLRRDMNFLVRWFLWVNSRPKEIRLGLLTSIAASYTPLEVSALMQGTPIKEYAVKANPVGLHVAGRKEE